MTHRSTLLLVLVSLAVATLALFTFTRQGFFLRSGQHNIGQTAMDGNYQFGDNIALYDGQKIIVPGYKQSLALDSILGETSVEDKRIEVNLSLQKLYAYEGNNLVYEFTVSTGKPWWATPTGEFRTWIKIRYQRMVGGSKVFGTYYDLPNVPYIMYFYNDNVPKWKGYGLHGAYWHNNFGYPMSHGCVNIKLEDAEQLYNWAETGIKVVIFGATPSV